MNVNFGLFNPINSLKSGRKARKHRYKAYMTDKIIVERLGKPAGTRHDPRKEARLCVCAQILDKVYKERYKDPKDLYREWADTYDSELAQNEYITPIRTAKALAALPF